MTSSDLKFFCTRFCLLFSLLICLSFLGFTYHAKQELGTVKSNLKVEQKALLEGKKNYIEWVIGSVVKETALLANLLGQYQIYQPPHSGESPHNDDSLERISKALVSMSQQKEIYDQIRFLDIEGNEVVRVNFSQGQAQLVPQAQLQNKAHRYYFQNAMALEHNQIYISPLDLNMEHGEIESPHKPTIRMAAPVYDENGTKRGIVVINYLANYLMEGLRLFNLNSGTNYMLINRDGYFLFNDLNPELEFAFMFHNKKEETIYQQFPELAEKIINIHSGQVESEKGIMTIESVGAIDKINPYCFQGIHISNNDTTAWKLVSYADFNARIDVQHPIAQHDMLITVGFALCLLLALCLATYQLRLHKDDQRIHYLAHYDSLTDLYNRGAFHAKSATAVKKAAKDNTPLCLIFIDMDDFKSINDTYGHQAGDKALRHVADAIKATFGDNAVVGRIGGDEFAVLLNGAQHLAHAQQPADQLLERIRQPLEVETNTAIQVSTSIGGHFCEGTCCEGADLIHHADTAMYQAKQSGKNCVVIMECTDFPRGATH
uniref:sensor domain-containing diguanylate cyclase n=1 Tax=Thaumasiovibrio occultus TaxID=1891184 RepID=UPI000B358C75|nr:sensor domain-containing diguanylate cyclase [Thaumasiovibrio occultus]